MRIALRHETTYRFDQPAAPGPHIIRLRPAGHGRTPVLSYSLQVEPKCTMHWQFDPWSNRIARVTFPEGTKLEQLKITVEASLDVRPVNPFNFFIDDRCQKVPFEYPDALKAELRPFLKHEAVSPALRAFVDAVPFTGSTVDYLVALNAHVARTVNYIIRTEAGIQTSEETLKLARGSCRDSAMLLCDALRARGLAARFVSGYLVQLADEGNIPDEAKGVSRDVVDLHAWAEVYIPGAGWIGLDGTSGLLCGEGHIPLAGTVNPELAAPIEGTVSEPSSGFDFVMEVRRLGHESRPRKPYDDDTWLKMLHAGSAVDATLADCGVKLTSGGEPTWTSRLHPEEPEWNTEALGPTKFEQGQRFARELAKRMGKGILTMRRMGKLYPGESLPRWICHLLWRADGKSIWRDQRFLSQFGEDSEGHPTAEDAEELGESIVRRLGLHRDLMAGFEDPWPSIISEENLPPDLDPMTFDLDDPEERRRLSRLLGQGLGNPVGFVCPLTNLEGKWLTSDWKFRREHLFLIPGDSPMGLRLPLDRLVGKAPEVPEADVSATRQPIRYDPDSPAEGRELDACEQVLPASLDTGPIRTALCVEPRDGVLHVFLPPLPTSEAFLELVRHIEDAAQKMEVKVAIEGYGPPSDPRIQSCIVTPDPGVIELNLPVAHSFAEYLRYLEIASEAAVHAGLSTEKYQLDGRAVGSGGGNHLTLGGPSLTESPFLQRPQLLASLIRYLQHHPSLSYLFTGLFVGPTSQAPRVDEARHDALSELDLALRQLPPDGQPVPPWLADRLLRNLLIDMSGNTHRTELCIDKLYSPEGPAGRQGIIELRAFEMPPNERMAAAQMLLLRALMARFAKQPYTQPFIKWGTRLHDQFMLPYFMWRDIQDIGRDLSEHGLPFDKEWFRPFLDYRFPVFGSLQLEDARVEVRGALEPWVTLGEQAHGPAVARMVDSSLERIQVRAWGLVEGRHVLAVNGVELPLHPTAYVNEQVAGIRFRAWQPPYCLQPNIPVHHPLRIDVVDTWGQRSLGACTYHVIHPEGRGFDLAPLTEFEASARRAQRFTTEGHTPYPVVLKKPRVNPEAPVTLDLRWQ